MNTRDLLGDVETFAGLINDTLTSFEDDSNSISPYTFAGSKHLEEITLPNITTVPNYLFTETTSLVRINIPNATALGNDVFNLSTGLINANFPNITTCGEYVFSECSNLESIAMNNLGSVPRDFASKCSKLESISLSSATSIGNSAFDKCAKLKNIPIELASKVTYVGEYAFRQNGLINIVMPSVRTLGRSAFYQCADLEHAVFKNLTTINTETFRHCTKLKYVDLGKVSDLGSSKYNNFTSADSITTVVIRTESVVPLGSTYNVPTNSSVRFYVPDDLVDSYKSATNWSSIASKILPISELIEWEDET